MCIGHGYDLHRLEPLAPAGSGKPLVICGACLDEAQRGPLGHSDGDVGYHALTDAILGAMGEDDLGTLFSNTDPQWRDADSSVFVREAVHRMQAAGYVIGNVDLTIICEQPQIAPHRVAMAINIAELLE